MFNVRGFELKLSMTACSYRGWKEGENIAHYYNVMLMNTVGTWAGSLDMRFRVFVYTHNPGGYRIDIIRQKEWVILLITIAQHFKGAISRIQ